MYIFHKSPQILKKQNSFEHVRQPCDVACSLCWSIQQNRQRGSIRWSGQFNNNGMQKQQVLNFYDYNFLLHV